MFAKDLTVFKCPNNKETMACSNCTKTNIKLRMNVDEVNEIVKLIYINGQYREIFSLRKVKHNCKGGICEYAELELFDKNNWKFQSHKDSYRNGLSNLSRYLNFIDGKIFNHVEFEHLKKHYKYQCAK